MLMRRIKYNQRRLLSQLAGLKDIQDESFRTSEQTPENHNYNHIGHFYTLKKDVCKQIFSHGGLPKSFNTQAKAFTETTIMVRKPAIDLMTTIKQSDLSQPAIRYVLYGEKGTGKSLTMAHLLHYAHESNYLLVHVPWVSEWLRRVTRYKEMSNSSTREGFVDLPLDAAAWLIHFKTQNSKLLKELDLKVSREYEWSKREKTEAGAPLLSLIDHGINRVKYASDVVCAIADEIKLNTNENRCKTFVAIDGFNSFFYPLTRLRTTTKRKVSPFEVTLTKPFLELTKNDWKNAVILLTVDQLAVPEDGQQSYLPRYLLGKEGFEHLDPFVPIRQPAYSHKEFLSCASYYRDRLWLRGTAQAETELELTSARNPYQLMEQCAPL